MKKKNVMTPFACACVVLFSFLLIGFGIPAYGADQTEEADELKDVVNFSLEELLNIEIKVATKTSSTLDKTPGIVTVIDRKMIDNSGARTLVDIIRMIPGFDYSRGSLGWGEPIDGFYARGILSDFSQTVLFLLNGRNKFNDLTYASPFMSQRINIDMIERIEVIRGPGSALYGGNAFSAVINIITRDTVCHSDSEFQMTVSENNSTSLYALIRNKIGKSDWYIGGQGKYFSEKGKTYDSLRYDKMFDQREIPSFELVTDGIEPSFDLSCNITSPGEVLRVGFWHTEHNPHPFLAGFYQQPKNGNYSYKTKQTFLNFQVKATEQLSVSGYLSQMSWDSRLTLYWDEAIRTSERPYGKDDIYAPGEKNRSGQLDIEYLLPIQKYTLLVGTSFTFESQYKPTTTYWDAALGKEVTYTETTPEMVSYLPFDRKLVSAFIQGNTKLNKKLELTAGLRFDKYLDEHMAAVLNPRIALVWNALNKTHFKFLYGEAFRPPAGFEAHGSLGNIFGNPNLKPEKIRTGEVAAITYLNFARLQLSTYYSKVSDTIALTDGGFNNIGKRTTYGLELELQGKHWWANYSFIHSKTGAERTPFLSQHIANAGVSQDLGNLFLLNMQTYYNSPRPIPSGGKSKHHFSVDVSLLYTHKKVTYSLGCRNLFDTIYELPLNNGGTYSYPYRDREIYLKATIRL